MTLKELIEKATPLPWWEDDDHFIAGGSGDSYRTVADPHAMMNDHGENCAEIDANKALILHAVNMLPKLVEALDQIHEWGEREHRFTVQWAATFGPIARAVLAEANNPEVK